MGTKDLGVVFEYIGAFGFTCFSFVFPGLFYILLLKKHATDEQKAKDGNRYKYISYMMLGLGAANMILVLIKTFANPQEVDPEEDPSAEDIAKATTEYLGQGIP